MSSIERNWQFTEQYPNETDAQVQARRLSLELGIEPVSRSIAAQLSAIVAATNARAICEIGTGVGVSGLSLLRYTTEATLTTLERDSEFGQHARTVFHSAGIPNAQVRLVEGEATEVLTRLNHGAYDVALIDADPEQLLEIFELTLLIVRSGGVILIPNAFVHGSVTEPASRGVATQNMRDLLNAVVDSPAIAAALSPAGDGLLMLTKISN